MSGRPLGRGLLWSLLVVVIVAVAAAAWLTRRATAPEPPPVLSEVPDFQLTNRDGTTVTRDDLLGAPWVADLFFTRCVLICPVMNGKMAILDRKLPDDVRLVSVTVDPERDTLEVLRDYAADFDASDRWYFLTGKREEIYALVGEGLRLGYEPNPPLVPLEPGDNIYHSSRFVLVDAEGRVRAYYETTEGNDLDRLPEDLAALE